MKKLLAALLILVLVLSMTACSTYSPNDNPSSAAPEQSAPAEDSSTDDQTAETPVIGVLVFDYSNNYCTYIRNAINYYAGEDVEIIMQDSQNDQAKQAEQVDTLLQRGVDALCVNLVEPESASTIIEKVKPTGKPLIFFNKCPSDEDMLSYDNAYYSGCSPYDGGVMQAEMCIDAVKANPAADKNGDGVINYVIIKGEPGHPDAELCTQANLDTLGAYSDGITFKNLDIQTANWRSDQAKDVMDAWIGRFGSEIEMVITNNDGMMLGGVEALKAAGWFGDDPQKQVLFIGHDAIPEAIPLIEDGTLYGCILQDAVNEGRATIVMAKNLCFGRPVEEDLGVELGAIKDFRSPFIKITKENTQTAVDIYNVALGN